MVYALPVTLNGVCNMTAMRAKDRGKEASKLLLPRFCVQSHLVRVASRGPPSR